MTPPTTDPEHDDLDEILALVDGPRDLPTGAEDRLLTAVLETASTPHPAPRPTHPARRSRRSVIAAWSPRLVGAVVAGAAVVAVIVGVALVPAGPTPPTILDGAPVEGLDSVDDAVLCSDATDLVAALRVDQPGAQATADISSLRTLAAVLDEFASRVEEGAIRPTTNVGETAGRAAIGAATLRLQARHLSAGDTDAAVRARVRTASVLLGEPPLLETLGCTSPGG